MTSAGAHVEVVRNDAVDVHGVLQRGADGLVLSPGPGHPGVARDVGVMADLLREAVPLPLLGVCLGLQAMVHFTGGRVVRAPHPVHGRASPVALEPSPLFAGLPKSVPVGRYHSLVAEEAALPPTWRVVARGDGLIMGIEHRERPWWGVQFHPESILTPEGPRILRNFVNLCNDKRKAH